MRVKAGPPVRSRWIFRAGEAPLIAGKSPCLQSPSTRRCKPTFSRAGWRPRRASWSMAMATLCRSFSLVVAARRSGRHLDPSDGGSRAFQRSGSGASHAGQPPCSGNITSPTVLSQCETVLSSPKCSPTTTAIPPLALACTECSLSRARLVSGPGGDSWACVCFWSRSDWHAFGVRP